MVRWRSRHARVEHVVHRRRRRNIQCMRFRRRRHTKYQIYRFYILLHRIYNMFMLPVAENIYFLKIRKLYATVSSSSAAAAGVGLVSMDFDAGVASHVCGGGCLHTYIWLCSLYFTKTIKLLPFRDDNNKAINYAVCAAYDSCWVVYLTLYYQPHIDQ